MEKPFKLEVRSFRRMDSPTGNPTITRYTMYAKTSSLEEGLLEYFETNPRYQNTDQEISLAIKDSLINNTENFHNLNKGILFSAKDVKYDTSSKLVEFNFYDKEIHGNIDGGHTLKIILKEKEKNNDILQNAYVFVEIFTGITTREEIVELAGARNKTVQVDTKSLANLERKFDPLKKLFEDSELIFKDRIMYKMNEQKEPTKPGAPKKDLDIRTIVAILDMFNLDIYANNKDSDSPIQSYTSKAVQLDKYLDLAGKNTDLDAGVKEIEKSVSKFSGVIKDIFELYEKIETEFPNAFNKNGKKYGSLDYAKIKGPQKFSKFDNKKLDYVVPDGIIYPILGSFRALISKDDSGKYYWKENPVMVWEKEKNKIAGVIADEKNVSDPQQIGKNKLLWQLLFLFNI